jgi:hypothetical protein
MTAKPMRPISALSDKKKKKKKRRVKFQLFNPGIVKLTQLQPFYILFLLTKCKEEKKKRKKKGKR